MFPLLVLLSCGSPSQTPTEAPTAGGWKPSPELKSHMMGHLDSVDRMWHALEQGDLEAARQVDEGFLDHKVAFRLPGSWVDHVTGMGEAAVALRDAKSLEQGSEHAAALVVACAGCHGEVEVDKALPTPPVDEGHPGARARLDALRYALVFPKDPRWQEASRQLVTALAEDPQANDELRELVARAEATKADARPAMAAEILTACANCHSR